MFDIALRRVKDQVVEPIVRVLPLWLKPGHITLCGFVVGLLTCLCASEDRYSSFAPNLWVINRFLDCLDGSLARERGTASEIGGFYDLLADFTVYSLLPIGVAVSQDSNYSLLPMGKAAHEFARSPTDWLAVAVLQASFHLNNFVLFYGSAVAAARADRELTAVTMRPALIEGFESGLIFLAMLIWPEYVNMWSWGMAGAVMIGVLQRSRALTLAMTRLETKKE